MRGERTAKTVGSYVQLTDNIVCRHSLEIDAAVKPDRRASINESFISLQTIYLPLVLWLPVTLIYIQSYY